MPFALLCRSQDYHRSGLPRNIQSDWEFGFGSDLWPNARYPFNVVGHQPSHVGHQWMVVLMIHNSSLSQVDSLRSHRQQHHQNDCRPSHLQSYFSAKIANKKQSHKPFSPFETITKQKETQDTKVFGSFYTTLRADGTDGQARAAVFPCSVGSGPEAFRFHIYFGS